MLLAEARRTRRWNPPSVSQSPQQPNDAAAAASATLPAIQPTNRQLTASKSSGSLLGQMPFTTMTTPTDPAMAFDQGLQGLQLSSPLFPPHNYLAYQQQVYSVPSYGEVSPATYSFAGQTGAPSASASSKDRNFAAPYYQTTSSSGSLQPTSGSDVYNRGAGRSSSGSFQQVSQSDPRSLSRCVSATFTQLRMLAEVYAQC